MFIVQVLWSTASFLFPFFFDFFCLRFIYLFFSLPKWWGISVAQTFNGRSAGTSNCPCTTIAWFGRTGKSLIFRPKSLPPENKRISSVFHVMIVKEIQPINARCPLILGRRTELRFNLPEHKYCIMLRATCLTFLTHSKSISSDRKQVRLGDKTFFHVFPCNRPSFFSIPMRHTGGFSASRPPPSSSGTAV